MRFLSRALLPALGLALGGLSLARVAAADDVRDEGAAAAASRSASEREGETPWEKSSVSWEHSATTDTLGLGRDYQSRNPTYEMSFGAALSYTLVAEESRELGLRGGVQLIREFTDSDSTTQRGEWTLSDAELGLAWTETLAEQTSLVLRAPWLTLPTSKVSADSGKILGLGLDIGISQQVSLRGQDSRVLSSAGLRARLGYSYEFSRAVVAVNDDIGRVRLFPEGRSLPSDQLTGVPLTQHQGAAGVGLDLALVGDLALAADLGVLLAYKYELEREVEVCGVVITGCAEVPARDDGTRTLWATLFALDLSYPLTEGLDLSVGYANLAGYLGPDGQHQNVLYSPDARAYASLSFGLGSVL